MEKWILEQIKKDKRFSFSNEFIIKSNADGSRYVYDSKGNLIEKTYADGTKNVYKRDRQGNLIEKTYADGTKDVYKRDKQGHLLEATYPDGTKYVYDKQGNVLET